MHWFPIVGFILLGLIFLDKGLRRRARRNWAWGRMGEGPPLSRISYVVLATMFFAIAFTLSRAPDPGVVAAVAIGLCFIVVVVAGIVDTALNRKKRTGSKFKEPNPDP